MLMMLIVFDNNIDKKYDNKYAKEKKIKTAGAGFSENPYVLLYTYINRI